MRSPQSSAEVTLEWIQAVFADYGRVSAFSVHPLSDHSGSISPLAKIRLQYDLSQPKREDAPLSVIGKFPGRIEWARMLELREGDFYQAGWIGSNVIPVPKCYFAIADSETDEVLVLLQDLSHFQVGSWATGVSRTRVIHVVQMLARMHANWWGKSVPGPDVLAQLVTDGEQLAQGLQFLAGVLQDDFLQLIIQNLKSITNEVERLGGMPGFFGRGPTTLVHGDAQLGNIFFDDRDEVVGVIDWQLYMQARAVYDLAYFSITLPLEFRREIEEEMLEHYTQELHRHGVSDYGMEQLKEDYPTALFLIGLMVLLRQTAYLIGAEVNNLSWQRQVVARVKALYDDWHVWDMVG